LAVVAAPAAPRAETTINRFVFVQLQHDGDWDPYPRVWEQAGAYLERTTSVTPWPQRQTLRLDDPRLFEAPFLLLAGRGAVNFSERELFQLRNYLSGGGMLFIDNTEAEKNSPFARSALALGERLFPGTTWETLPANHAVFRSFFLLRGAAGRRLADPSLKGLRVQDRVAVVYSPNDVLGAWALDPLGKPLHPCEPGGEIQRADSFKLLINVFLFSLTGTYKTDAIHQPFLERKLGQ